MADRIITRNFSTYNADKLHEQLKTLLPTKYLYLQGMGNNLVDFHFTEDVTDEELLNARDSIINLHVPGQLTDAQTLRLWVKNLPVTAATDPSTLTNAQVQKATLALILWLKSQL
jgi:hypothetical protein